MATTEEKTGTEDTTFAPDEADATQRWQEFEASLDEIDVDGEEDEFLSADIPVKSSSINLGALHPELQARLAQAFSDDRISRIARVSSGVRTYEQQKYLYALYGRGRAANPDYVRGDGRRGSAHMVQPPGFRYAGGFEPGKYGYAVDIGFWGNPQWELLRKVLGEHGLRLTVFRPFEPWHFELDPSGRAAAAEFALAVTGSGVADIQTLLAKQHEALPNTISDPGKADGDLGPKTETAITAWQALIGVDADGSWGPATETATADWLALRASTVRKGSKGDDARAVQLDLTARHEIFPDDVVNPGAVDGSFGRRCEKAAKGWQTKLEIDSDGVWGPATWAASDRFDDQQRAE